MQLARLHVEIATVIKYQVQWEKHVGHRKKVYTDSFTSQGCEAVNKLIGHVRGFVPIWEPEKLELPSEITESYSKENKNQKVLEHSERALRNVCVRSVNRISIFVEIEWLTKYIEEKLELNHDRYIAEIVGQLEAVTSLGCEL